MFVTDRFGFDVSFIYVSLLLLAVMLFTLFFVKDPTLGSRIADKSSEVLRKFRDSLTGFLRELRVGFFQSGPGPLVGVLFALLPFGAMALTSGVATTLQVDIGMTDGQIAELNIYGTVVSAFGCVFGGWLADRLGRRKMLAAYYSLTIVPTLYMASMLGGEAGLGGITIAQYFTAALTFSLFVGMHYGTSAAIFMGLTNPAIAATQFTGFMALRNLTYSTMLYIDAALAIIPILVIPFLAERKAQRPPSMGAPLPEAG
jgi:PAT family beta-lactamase induction signal transducer AmpG